MRLAERAGGKAGGWNDRQDTARVSRQTDDDGEEIDEYGRRRKRKPPDPHGGAASNKRAEKQKAALERLYSRKRPSDRERSRSRSENKGSSTAPAEAVPPPPPAALPPQQCVGIPPVPPPLPLTHTVPVALDDKTALPWGPGIPAPLTVLPPGLQLVPGAASGLHVGSLPVSIPPPPPQDWAAWASSPQLTADPSAWMAGWGAAIPGQPGFLPQIFAGRVPEGAAGLH